MAEQQKHILIVDDDIELGDLLSQAIKDMFDSYDVKVARNVDEALALVRKSQTLLRPFDLVITDIKMAGLSGLELLEVLQSISPNTKTIAMTAYNSPDLEKRARELGICEYLNKPFVISEFRRVVQKSLAVAEPEPPTIQLSAAQESQSLKQLASLRMMTGANAAMLIHSSGIMLAIDSLAPSQDVSGLGSVLLNTQQHVWNQMNQDLGNSAPIKQSYFGTEMYSVCTYAINESFVVAVIFGPAVKEGQVWYYMRDAAESLREALTAAKVAPTPEPRRKRGDVFDMLDQFFPGQTGRRATRREAASEPAPTETRPTRSRPAPPAMPEKTAARTSSAARPVEPEIAAPETILPEPVRVSPAETPLLSIQEAQNLGFLSDLFGSTAETPASQTGPDAPTAPVALDEIDWNVPVAQGWDDLVSDLDALPAQAVAPEPAAAEPEPAASAIGLDEINWDVPTNVDWDQLVSDADQGFGGMNLEQARRQGIVKDIQNE